jgi:hypothetical protein
MEAPLFGVVDLTVRGNADPENPFAVDLTADFTHESGQRLEGVQGYYAGDGEWVVRFSPTRAGTWRGTTASDVPALDDRELGPVDGLPNADPDVHGRLRTDPDDPRRFRFEDGSEYVPLGFEFDWLFAYHQAEPQECRQTLEILADRGFNHIVMNLYAHTGFSEPEHPDVYGPPDTYLFGGTNDDPDHRVLNPAFFRDFDEVMELLYELGLVSHLLIQVQNKGVNWPERGSPADDRFWRYVVARYAAYPNLLWDLSKECFYLDRETGSHGYAVDRMELVRETDAYDHLVTAHDTATGSFRRRSDADRVADFVTDQIHLGDADAYYRETTRRFREHDAPYLNVEYGYEVGVDAIETYENSLTTAEWEDVLVWTWAVYAGGGYPCYYYNNTAWDLIRPEPEPPSWERYADLRATLEAFDLNRMRPDREFVSRGLALVDPGRQYLLFLPEGGDVEVDLTDVDRVVDCEALDVLTGDRASVGLEPGGFETAIENPLPAPDHPCAVAVQAEPSRARGE